MEATRKQKEYVKGLADKFGITDVPVTAGECSKFIDALTADIDLNEIKDQFSPIEVVEMLGIPYEKRGKTYQILCPLHDDKHFGSCVLTERGFYCFRCNEGGTTLDLVSKTLGLNSHDAGMWLLVNSGQDIKTYKRLGGRIKTGIRLSSDDREMLGLVPDFGKSIVIENIYPEEREGCQKVWAFGDEHGYARLTHARISLNELYAEDPEAYYEMIRDKAEDMIEFYGYFASISDTDNENCLTFAKLFCPDKMIKIDFLKQAKAEYKRCFDRAIEIRNECISELTRLGKIGA